MPKSLSTFLEECRREIPNEVIHVSKPIDPAHYDATAIIKHLGAQKKFPIAIFEQPLNLRGNVSEFKLVLNCEISQRKTREGGSSEPLVQNGQTVQVVEDYKI